MRAESTVLDSQTARAQHLKPRNLCWTIGSKSPKWPSHCRDSGHLPKRSLAKVARIPCLGNSGSIKLCVKCPVASFVRSRSPYLILKAFLRQKPEILGSSPLAWLNPGPSNQALGHSPRQVDHGVLSSYLQTTPWDGLDLCSGFTLPGKHYSTILLRAWAPYNLLILSASQAAASQDTSCCVLLQQFAVRISGTDLDAK